VNTKTLYADIFCNVRNLTIDNIYVSECFILSARFLPMRVEEDEVLHIQTGMRMDRLKANPPIRKLNVYKQYVVAPVLPAT